MKGVLYNQGGYVAHVSLKINTEDSFNAFNAAANIAQEHEGQVESLFEDSKFGARTRVLGVEKAGLVVEFGTFEDTDALAREIDRLREGIKTYLENDPRRAGHADAHRNLAALVADD